MKSLAVFKVPEWCSQTCSPPFFLAAGTNTADFALKTQVVMPPVKCEQVLGYLIIESMPNNGHIHTHKCRFPSWGTSRVGITDMQSTEARRPLHLWSTSGGFPCVSMEGIAQDSLPAQPPTAFPSPSAEMVMHTLSAWLERG